MMQCRGAIVPGPGGGSGGGKVSDNDTTPGTLEEKIVGAGDVSVTVLNEGGNEQLQIDVDVDLSAVEADILDLQYVAEYHRLVPPVSPSSLDDDFTADTTADWTKTTSFSGTIDPYAKNTSSNPRIDIGNYRHKCWTIQPRDSNELVLSKAITLDTNCAFYLEASVGDNSAAYSAVNNFANLGLVLSANATNTSGHYIICYVDGQTGANKASFFDRNMTAGYALTGQIPTTAMRGSHYTRVAIQKIGSDYHGYTFAPSGACVHLGSVTYSGNTLGHVGFYMYDKSSLYTRLFQIKRFRYYANQIKFPV
jgi:hypothetical protein